MTKQLRFVKGTLRPTQTPVGMGFETPLSRIKIVLEEVHKLGRRRRLAFFFDLLRRRFWAFNFESFLQKDLKTD
ncbi:MAG: hypothetical protein V7K64_21680 [Nostoc sp.]|uniref:hypothetical protein n=1 Tax=Nostoc sp. TaxID=1180 RepID=UPI002FFD045E